MRASWLIVLLFIPLLAAACDNSAPSKSEAGAAIDHNTARVLEGLGVTFDPNRHHADVIDLKCAEAGNDIYTCVVLTKDQGEELTGNWRFTKLGGKWRAEPIN